MLENIKSLFFTKIIFLNLDEKRKLQLIKYNKKLQKELNLNIINYRIISGKYITYETKEKIKVYNSFTEHLLVEGEYFKGKGREYYNGHLICEGEYLNGKRNGKCKTLFYNGRISSEGEFLNGKKWNVRVYDNKGNNISELKEGKGYVKEYKGYYSLVFEGDYLNGERNGKGKEYKFGDLIYEGEYLNDKRHGKGKEFFSKGEIKAAGEYFYGKKWNVKRYDIRGNVIYEIKNGKGFIKGKRENEKDMLYEGEYSNGNPNGKGKVLSMLGKKIYEGEFLNGYICGKGKEYNNEGELIFEGEYYYNHRLKGKEYIKGKLEFEGDYLSKQKWNGKGYDENGNIIYELINGNGKVKEYNINGTLSFEGEYLNGKKNGKVKEYNTNGNLIFKGRYKNGKKNGIGKDYQLNGKLRFVGEYSNGKRNGIGYEYDNNGNLIFKVFYANNKRKGIFNKKIEKN